MAYQGVTLKGVIPDNDLTFILNSEIKAEHVGLVVTQDKNAANTVKLAGAGDPIVGVLQSYEDRTATSGIKTGAVKLVGGMELKIASSYSSPAVGDKVIGAGEGLVTKITTGQSSDVVVWEVRSNSVIVIKNS